MGHGGQYVAHKMYTHEILLFRYQCKISQAYHYTSVGSNPVSEFEVRYFWRIRGEGVILNSEAFQVWIFPPKFSNVVVFALDKSPAELVPISVFL